MNGKAGTGSDTTLALRDGERWYAVQTLPRRELGAALQLQAQQFRSFVPAIFRTVRHARKLRTVRAPLFPRYMFVVLDLDRDRWRSVNGTFAVAGLVMEGDRPCPVPHGVVEALIDLTDQAGIVRLDRGLAPGTQVRVLAGPFVDAIGRLERLGSDGRVKVLLDIMGGTMGVTLDRALLTRAA